MFLRDGKGDHFFALQWYSEVGKTPIHPIALLPQLVLAPTNNIDSYDVMPISSIVNGALLLENGGFHWAIQSPRELQRYIAINSPDNAN